MTTPAFPFLDTALARRLERAEGHANMRFVESRARVAPSVGACWTREAGAFAMFDGVGSPLTQTFGLGISEPPTRDALQALETFFESRGASTFHEVSPLADPTTLSLLNERAYTPCELTSVLVQPLPAARLQRVSSDIVARVVDVTERELWARTAFQGWEEFAEVREFMASFGPTAVATEDAFPFLAWLGEKPVAAGSMSIFGGVALLAGASTIPEARGRGAQGALLAARLQSAVDRGCDLAMMCAAPGSASHRNAERQGFRVAYTRIKWHKPIPFPPPLTSNL
jgi:GNAT superfamily N-acetyltransferase